MIFQHSRFQIWNQNQHPFRHNLSELLYSHPALPGVSNTQGALDYITAVLYPQSKAAVANPAALPLVGNTINDMRVVQDDGDGKAAAYRWEQREGEVAASWHKIYDLDWGTDSILQGFLLKTQDIYVKQWGYDDLDPAGNPVAGLLAGQSLYGGATAGTNLTFFANGGDGVGADTGFVQFGDNVRPTSNNAFDFGTTALRWGTGWFTGGQFGTLVLAGGSITDTSGVISFANEDLTTTGTVMVGTLVLAAGSITDTSGAISFANENLTTTGTVAANSFSAPTVASAFASGTTVGDLTLTNGNIASASATLGFNALNLTTTGNVAANTFNGSTVNAGNLRLSASTLETVAVNGSIILLPNGTGVVDVQGDLDAVNVTASGALEGAVLTVDNVQINGNTVSTLNANGNLLLDPNGTGQVVSDGVLRPNTDNVSSLGQTSFRWTTLFFSTSLSNGTDQITAADLLSLRNTPYRDAARTLPAQAGDALFWDGSMWLASAPDSEISHSTLSGLTTGDSGHTQFVMLAGRAGGQYVRGGTAASENLDLESTSHATKGFVQTKDSFRAFTDASFSGSWSGADLGGSGNRFRHVYTAGEHFGLRLENVGALPGSSAQNVGRLVYLTTDGSPYVDTGTSFERIGYRKFQSDTVWNGSDTTKTVTVSSTIDDARTAHWQLCDNTNDFDRIYCSLKPISATQVLITVGSALPAGSYRLIGIE